MTRWSDALFDDEQSPSIIQAQSPIQRPDPIARPEPIERPGSAPPRAMPRPQPQGPAPGRFQFKPQDAPRFAPGATGGGAQEPGQPKMRWSDSIFDDEAVGPKVGPQPDAPRPGPVSVPFAGYKDPKQEGWMEWAANNVAGRKDPRYQGLPSIQSVLKDEIFLGNLPDDQHNKSVAASRHLAIGHGLTNDELGQANIVKRALGDRFISLEKDAYGAHVVNYRDHGGMPKKAYVNVPGLDMEDMNDTANQTLPYLAMGRMIRGVAPQTGGLTSMAGQGMGATSVSLLQDIGALAMGSEKAPDNMKAGMVGLIAAGVDGLSPIAGNLFRRFVVEPRLYDKATKQLTDKGAEAARRAGFNPEDITGDMVETFAKKYAELRNPQIVGQSMRTGEFDIPVSRGQMTKDPGYLLNEKAMRYGAFGDAAKGTMRDFDTRQAQAVTEAALGGGEKSVARTINPQRAATTTKPGDVGAGVQGGLTTARDTAKSELSDAWKQVGPQYATAEAMDSLPSFIASELKDMAPLLGSLDKNSPAAAPVAKGMVDLLRKFRSGEPMHQADDFLGGATIPELDSLRRTLGKMMDGTQGGDREAAGRVYRGFNAWLRDSGERGLLAGDMGAYEAAAKARDLTSQFKDVFTAESLAGPPTPGRKIVEKILATTDNPESVVRGLFGVDPGSTPKQGAVEAIRLIKQGVTRHMPEDQAKAVIDDIRLAHWMNVVKNGQGEVHTPTMIAKRIDQALNSQTSVMRELYTPAEIALIRRFGAAMKDISWKDPNPSGTGTANLFHASQWGQALVRTLHSYNGPLGKIMQMTLGALPIKNVAGAVSAQAAVGARAQTINPSLGPVGGYLADRRREAQ